MRPYAKEGTTRYARRPKDVGRHAWPDKPFKKAARRAGRDEIHGQLAEAEQPQPPPTVEEIASARYERAMQDDLAMMALEDERERWDPEPYDEFEYEEHVYDDRRDDDRFYRDLLEDLDDL